MYIIYVAHQVERSPIRLGASAGGWAGVLRLGVASGLDLVIGGLVLNRLGFVFSVCFRRLAVSASPYFLPAFGVWGSRGRGVFV